jgi:CheY-like chemotaxis protein
VEEPLSILMAGGSLSIDEAVRIVREAANGLASIHGELWPSAILVDGARVRIEPAGSSERTRYGQYAPPERILGKPATLTSDVFSLGAILYHAVAGRPPFRGDTPAEIMLAACMDAPLPIPPHVPGPLASVIERCLARDPEQRFASPRALASALDLMNVRDNFPGRRILVADDDAPVRDFYVQVAGRIGVEADVVASGRDAIAAMKSRKYDLALMDLNMPRLSGWEVLDFLRSRYDIRPKRLFIVTGFSDQQISHADQDLVTAVLYKPVASEELRTLVVECLRGGAVDVRSILRTTGHRLSAS